MNIKANHNDAAMEALLQTYSDLRTFNLVVALAVYDTIICLAEYASVSIICEDVKAKWSSGKFLYIGSRYSIILYLLMLIPMRVAKDCSISVRARNIEHYQTGANRMSSRQKFTLTFNYGACNFRWLERTFSVLRQARFHWRILPGMSVAMLISDPIVTYVHRVNVGLMAFRTYALYAGKRTIKWFIILLFVSEQIALLGMFGLITAKATFTPPPMPGLPCIFSVSSRPRFGSIGAYLCGFVLGVTLWTMSLTKLLRIVLAGERSIVLILLRDGALYFTICTLLLLSEVLVFLFVPEQRSVLRDIALPVMISMSSVLSGRFILHLREHVFESCRVESRSLPWPSFREVTSTKESPRFANSYASQYC
ncbi:hypothetical protein ACEPAI_8619 [Sanghuangporus weigelae]